MTTKAKTAAKTTKPAAKPAKKIVKKAPALKAKAKKAKVEKEPLAITPVRDPLNRTELLDRYATALLSAEIPKLELTERQAKALAKVFLEEQKALVLGSVHHKGSGIMVIPGLMKIQVRDIPAKKMPAIKKGTMVRKPGQADLVPHEGREAFTKPATRRVKVRPLALMKQAATQK